MSKIDDLEKIQKLKQEGILTDEEFKTEKEKILGINNTENEPKVDKKPPTSNLSDLNNNTDSICDTETEIKDKPYAKTLNAKSFCTNCGNELEEGDKFCGKCGQKVKTGRDLKLLLQNKKCMAVLVTVVLLIIFIIFKITTTNDDDNNDTTNNLNDTTSQTITNSSTNSNTSSTVPSSASEYYDFIDMENKTFNITEEGFLNVITGGVGYSSAGYSKYTSTKESNTNLYSGLDGTTGIISIGITTNTTNLKVKKISIAYILNSGTLTTEKGASIMSAYLTNGLGGIMGKAYDDMNSTEKEEFMQIREEILGNECEEKGLKFSVTSDSKSVTVTFSISN